MVFVSINIKEIDFVKINKKISYHSKKKVRFTMKAKYYMGILLMLLLSSNLKAQTDNPRYNGNDNARLVVNNYYDDNDYSFTSRINRFHRPYGTFDYYSPVFTDPYLYNRRPFSLGLNFFAGRGFGLGFSLNFPLFNFGFGLGDNYGYDSSYGYDPYYGYDNYWGYDPFYYNSWCSPFMFNFNFWPEWRGYYSGWRGYNYYHNHDFYNYRSGYYANNYSHGNNSYRNTYNTSRRNPVNNSQTTNQSNNVSRRGVQSENYSRNTAGNNRPEIRSNNRLNTGGSGRNIYAGLNNDRSGNRINTVTSNGRPVRANNGPYTSGTGRNTYAGLNNGGSGNRINAATSNGRSVRANTGAGNHFAGIASTGRAGSSSYRSMSASNVHSSSSRSMHSGSGISSSHGGSRSHGSSGGRSSGRR
jgi:hypothetical protein